jgi:HD-GYP domain-containing protein (c-di-GMP phosphodiesterase class II)
MTDRRVKLQRIIQIGIEVSQIKDLDVLLEKVLSEARYLVHADAGSIYIKEGNMLKFSYSQNETLRKRLEKGKKLIYTTFSMPITEKSIAGFVAKEGKLLNIPDAYKIPESMSFSFDSSYDKKTGYETHSVLTVPLKNNRGECIGVLQLINAQDESNNIISFTDEDELLIKPFAMYAAVAIERAQLTRTTILRMISMAELRDPKETGAHVNRVASYAIEIYENWANKKGIDLEDIDKHRDAFRLAAMLHDVGKVAVSDTILKKPGRFTDEEYDKIKLHTIEGARLFAGARSDFDEIAAEVALTHHERWDGAGYPGFVDIHTGEAKAEQKDASGKPRGRKAEEIPIYGRIVALADVYDALSSKRSYKEAWDEEKVLNVLREEKGKHFDPEVVESFFDVLDVIRSISQRYPDES